MFLEKLELKPWARWGRGSRVKETQLVSEKQQAVKREEIPWPFSSQLLQHLLLADPNQWHVASLGDAVHGVSLLAQSRQQRGMVGGANKESTQHFWETLLHRTAREAHATRPEAGVGRGQTECPGKGPDLSEGWEGAQERTLPWAGLTCVLSGPQSP